MDAWQKYFNLEVRQCLVCSHYWHHTQPEFLKLLGMYEASVPLKKNLADPAREPSPFMLKSMSSLYELAFHTKGEPPTLLDYGSGRGRWARAAVVAGFRVWAYEPSASRANEGIKDFPIVNDLAELAGIHFDVVNIEQVLEHTQEPFQVLSGLIPLLKSESLVRITVPNVMRMGAKNLWSSFPFDGEKMHIMSPYEHLQGFSPQSLQALLLGAGFIYERSFSAWKKYPLHFTRALFGRWFPRFGTTMALVRPAKTPSLLR
jgi:hypothetical protein